MATDDNPCAPGTPEPCGVNPAFKYTRYPCDFDDPRSQDVRGLPVIVDLQTPVKAEVVNRHRESVLAIEAELGIQPSGTFTTVRDRLDALESLVCAGIGDGIIGAIEVKSEGISIVNPANTLNFIGSGVSVVDAGDGQANVIIGNVNDGSLPVHEALAVTAPGQTVFTLSSIAQNNLLILYINGIKQEIGDYTVVDNKVTWTGSISLITTDIVEVHYFNADASTQYKPVHEALTVAAPAQTLFTLTTTPYNSIVLLFIDGVKQEIGDYTIVGNQLTWNGSVSLAVTDVVEVLYYVVSANPYSPVHQALPVSSIGQINFALSTAAEDNIAMLSIEGIKQELGDYSVLGSLLSWSGSEVLVTTDVVEVLFWNDGNEDTNTLAIYDDGYVVDSTVNIIDFGENIKVTSSGSGIVTVSGPTRNVDKFTASVGQVNFALSNTPIGIDYVDLFISGASQIPDVDYTLSGTTVVYSDSPSLSGGESVVIKYWSA